LIKNKGGKPMNMTAPGATGTQKIAYASGNMYVDEVGNPLGVGSYVTPDGRPIEITGSKMEKGGTDNVAPSAARIPMEYTAADGTKQMGYFAGGAFLGSDGQPVKAASFQDGAGHTVNVASVQTQASVSHTATAKDLELALSQPDPKVEMVTYAVDGTNHQGFVVQTQNGPVLTHLVEGKLQPETRSASYQTASGATVTTYSVDPQGNKIDTAPNVSVTPVPNFTAPTVAAPGGSGSWLNYTMSNPQGRGPGKAL
jgi:hypothetical protein